MRLNLKNFEKGAPLCPRKLLAESTLLPLVVYGDQVYTPLIVILQKHLLMIYFAAASVVAGSYVKRFQMY